MNIKEDLEMDYMEDAVELDLTSEPEPQQETKPEKPGDGVAEVTIEDLFLSNFHFGYKTKYRHASMSSYVFRSQNGIDIIDLNKTAILFKQALAALRKCVARGGRVLFVGTESHAASAIKANAERCAQYYVSKRWLGGLLTNWINTFSMSIMSLKKLQSQIDEGYIKNFTKREQMAFIRKRDRFLKFLAGVKDMGTLPNMVVIASNREKNAIKEAQLLGIPVVMLMDTTSNPNNVRYPVPGNDRSIKTIDKFCSLCADACLAGLKDEANFRATRLAKQAQSAPQGVDSEK